MQNLKLDDKDRRPKLKFTVNGHSYEWSKQYITGNEIREIAQIDPKQELFLSIRGPWTDEEIFGDTRVNLARPEIEHFYSKDKDRQTIIIVNGKEKPWEKTIISFEEVVILAFEHINSNPDICYTVTYDKGPRENREGMMVKGDQVHVKNKMIFNATATDKS